MKIISPWIQLTNKCNLDCDYCHVKKNNKVMNIDTFNKINDKYSRILGGDKDIVVQYRIAGGEPTIVIEKYIKPINDIIKKYGDRFKVELITNGTLLNENIMDWLYKYKNNIGLCVSVDWYDKKMIKILTKLIKHNILFSVSTVIIENGKYIPRLAKYIFDNGIYWDINLNKLYDEHIILSKIFKSIDKLFNIIYKYKYKIKKIQFNGIDFYKNTGCGAGEKLSAIDTDGKEYPCQLLFGSKNYKEYDINKCAECRIRYYCGYGCKYDHIKKREDYFCKVNKYYFMKGAKYAVSL